MKTRRPAAAPRLTSTLALAAALGLAALSLVGVACGGGSGSAAPAGPTVSPRPSDHVILNIGNPGGHGVAEPVVLQFSTGMDRASVVLGGQIGAEATSRTWSSRLSTDDTLTLGCATWTEGPARHLTVTGKSAGGATLPATDLVFDVGAWLGDVTVAPVSVLAVDQAVVARFNFSVDRSTLRLTGTLAPSFAPTWSTYATTDDTVTLTPVATWAPGTDVTLGVEGTSVHSPALFAASDVTFLVGGTSPTATIAPASGTGIGARDTLVVTFDRGMDPVTVQVGGELGLAAGPAIWSTSVETDDTVTLHPRTTWPAGAGMVLTVQAADLQGRTLRAPLQASYTVTALATCGTGSGACVNETDCAFPVSQIGGWTQACVVAGGLGATQTAVSACVHSSGPTTGCSDCAATFGLCALNQCFSTCAGGFSAPACVTCLASKGCTAAFTTCSGLVP